VVAVPRDLFRRILDLIDDLRPREPTPCCGKHPYEAGDGRIVPASS
jgi:hypothetical protein